MTRYKKIKKLKRYAKQTVLCVGEGSTEKAFLDYIKSIYLSRNSGISVTNRSGDGGSPESVIKKAVKWKRFDSFDLLFILLDSDCPIPNASEKIIRKMKGTIIISTPCIEGLFLLILGNIRFNPEYHNSDWCKTEFHNNHLSEPQKMFAENYHSIFPEELLEKKRHEISTLEKIVSIYNRK